MEKLRMIGQNCMRCRTREHQMLKTGAAPEFPESAAEHGLMLPQVNILYGNKCYIQKDILLA
jgi:hypothetical protein